MGRGNSGVEKTTYRGAVRSVLLTKFNSGDQIKKNEMGGPCSTYGRKDRCIQDFDGKSERGPRYR